MSYSGLEKGEHTQLLIGASPHKVRLWGILLGYKTDPPEEFTHRELIQKLEDESAPKRGGSNTVQHEMHRLWKLGMLARGSEVDRSIRTDSPDWRILEAAVESIHEQFPEEDS